ncbi:hypothetical protein RHI9324_03018 [Rhizobium sp. CECT 9324]|nr:hypothetical protein RHI9324_03018 [Rhizobium sp. CECT 9324]
MHDSFSMESFLPYRLIRATERLDTVFMQYCGPEDELSWSEWQVLWSLGEAVTTTAKAICGQSGLSKTKISRAVKVLDERGYLERKRDAHDRRFELLSLTPAGSVRFAAFRQRASEFQHRLEAIVDMPYLSALDTGLGGLEDLMAAGHFRQISAMAEGSLA